MKPNDSRFKIELKMAPGNQPWQPGGAGQHGPGIRRLECQSGFAAMEVADLGFFICKLKEFDWK